MIYSMSKFNKESSIHSLSLAYSLMVHEITKPGKDILESLTPEKCNLLHMAVGISGEAGELLDAIKKHVIYNKPLDITNIIEELGDIEFYLEGLRQALTIARAEALSANMNKLYFSDTARYREGTYSDLQAQQRIDKNGSN